MLGSMVRSVENTTLTCIFSLGLQYVKNFGGDKPKYVVGII